MAQKPVIQKSRKTIEGAKKPAAKDSVKKVEKAVGAGGSTLGNIDSLVNKHLAAFRNAEKTLAQAKALVQTYGKKYPELAGYIPAGAAEERREPGELTTEEAKQLLDALKNDERKVPAISQQGRAAERPNDSKTLKDW